jgi:hypothetical protein
MELILGAIIVVIGAIFRKIVDHFGVEMGKAITLIFFFVLSGIFAFVYQSVDQSFWIEAGKLFAYQMTIYQVIFKNILQPLWDEWIK